jgi:hypothetical protein
MNFTDYHDPFLTINEDQIIKNGFGKYPRADSLNCHFIEIRKPPLSNNIFL